MTSNYTLFIFLSCTKQLPIVSYLQLTVEQGLKHTQRPRVSHVTRGAFWDFSNNYNFNHLVDSPVFKSARPESKQVPFKRTYGRLEMICL